MDIFQIRVAGNELGDIHARAAFKLDVCHQQSSASAGDQKTLFPGGEHLARFSSASGRMEKPGKNLMLRMRFLRFQ